MSSNVLFFGWNRSIPGREKMSAEHFQAFRDYRSTQQRKGLSQGFEPILLDPHGGDLNGFFLIRGDSPQLDTLMASDDWRTHTIRAAVHLDTDVRGRIAALAACGKASDGG
ncbi:MAG: hypothetical protein IV097_03305 [Burkholderiaceae bacterium]|nr:hypothetical protein [Burkholderiaceae bacterium]